MEISQRPFSCPDNGTQITCREGRNRLSVERNKVFERKSNANQQLVGKKPRRSVGAKRRGRNREEAKLHGKLSALGKGVKGRIAKFTREEVASG